MDVDPNDPWDEKEERQRLNLRRRENATVQPRESGAEAVQEQHNHGMIQPPGARTQKTTFNAAFFPGYFQPSGASYNGTVSGSRDCAVSYYLPLFWNEMMRMPSVAILHRLYKVSTSLILAYNKLMSFALYFLC
jgi:hypothetical protein